MALQKPESLLAAKCLRPEDASPEMLSAGRATLSFRQLVRLLTLDNERNVLLSQMLHYALAN